MKYTDQEGNIQIDETGQDRLLEWLYTHGTGRLLLKPLIRPSVSGICGRLLDLPCSRRLIGPFVRRHGIDLALYEKQDFDSYNDFFTRQIKKENRPMQGGIHSLVSPCDGKLSVYPIGRDRRFRIKHTDYSLKSLLRSEKLARRYEGGFACVFRLTVDDYHRYCYVDGGTKSDNIRIPGVFHTVNPIANDVYPIYKENTREYSLLKSNRFGTILMMEVGALLVGRICNYHQSGPVKPGQEKGRFEFGGSTVILLFQRNAVEFHEGLLENTRQGFETKVRMGECLGESRVAGG